jgi:hypothetical protein
VRLLKREWRSSTPARLSLVVTVSVYVADTVTVAVAVTVTDAAFPTVDLPVTGAARATVALTLTLPLSRGALAATATVSHPPHARLHNMSQSP